MRYCSFLALVLLSSVASAQEDTSPHCDVDLTAAFTKIEPGSVIAVGLRFRLDPGWHFYWKNPGESGLPPEIKWTLPEGFEIVETYWPTPHRVTVAGMVNYVYEDEATLLVQIRVPGEYEVGTVVPYKVELSYQVCETSCMIANDVLVGELPGSAQRQDLISLRKKFPTQTPVETMVFERDGDDVTLGFRLQNLPKGDMKSAYFFASSGNSLVTLPAQDWSLEGSRLTIRIKSAKNAPKEMKAPEGVLVIKVGDRTLSYEFFRAKEKGQSSRST